MRRREEGWRSWSRKRGHSDDNQMDEEEVEGVDEDPPRQGRPRVGPVHLALGLQEAVQAHHNERGRG